MFGRAVEWDAEGIIGIEIWWDVMKKDNRAAWRRGEVNLTVEWGNSPIRNTPINNDNKKKHNGK